MEDPNKESQDSETSSTSSWILLSNDEIAENMVPETKKVVLAEAVEKLYEIDLKNNQSDVESDGISIISESEFSHGSKSDDDNTNSSGDEKYEDKRNSLENMEYLLELKQEDFREQNYETKGIETIIQEKSMNITNVMEQLQEGTLVDSEEILDTHEGDIIESTEKDEVEDTFSAEMLVVQREIPGSSNLDCPDNLIQIYDYKKLLTWPSLLCTSIVILAVLIFPYFSSKLDNTNIMDQPNVENYDVHLLPEKEILDMDPILRCREIHKDDDLYNDHNIKKCIRKMLKQIKKAKKHQINRELNFLDREIDKRSKNNIMENQEIEITYKKMYKKENNKEYKRQKYIKMYKYNNIDKDKKLFEKNDEYNYENEESGKLSKKNWKFAYKKVSSRGDDMSNPDLIVKGKNKNFEFVYESKNKGQNIEKHWYYQQKKDSTNSSKQEEFNPAFEREKLSQLEKELSQKKQLLQDKEKLLKEWEAKLIDREKRIQEGQKNMKVDKFENNFLINEKYQKIKKRKGDFDDDNDSQGHKFMKNKKQKKAKNTFEDSSEENTKCSKRHYQNKNDKKTSYEKNSKVLPSEKFSKKFGESDNKESIIEVNINNSKYLKMQNIPNKNQTGFLGDDNITVTGEWYLNLIESRQTIRKKEDKAVWWFDRAEFRKNKRNKAYWYFQYMFNRENLRYRPKNI